MLVFILAFLDYSAIRYGQINELRITGYNHGLVAAENVTFTWRRYWENCEFIFSLPISKESNGYVTLELGDLPANSSVVISMQINLLYEVPSGTVVTQTHTEGSYISPTLDNPVWLVAPYYIFVPYSNPDNKILVQLNVEDATVDFIYYFENSTKISYIYNGTDLVDKIVSENETEPNTRRLSTRSISRRNHRRLSCFNFWAGVEAAIIAAAPWPLMILQGRSIISFFSRENYIDNLFYQLLQGQCWG